MTDIRSLDMGPLATVTLSNGEKLDVPRLTTMKLIQIAKFAAIDGMKIYERFRDVIESPDMTEAEKVTIVVSELKEEQIVHLLAILLGISDEEALHMDPFDTLEIITTYVEKTDVEGAFMNVRKLMDRFSSQKAPVSQAPNENHQEKSVKNGSAS